MRKLLLLFCVWVGCITSTYAQVREIRGRVTDTTGSGIPSATVQVKGTKVTAVADGDGRFAIKASPGDILVFSSSGMGRREVQVGTTSTLDVRIVPQAQNLSEVVVTTALGIRRQARELGYATTQIKTAELNQAAVVNPATGLAAKVAGVDIRLADNGVNPQVKVTFRGSRSIEGNNAALIVVDGIPVDQQYLANINPNEIEDITILKGSNAAALYGMSASNGVMVITTKKGKGKFSLTYQNVVSAESISYFPSLQNEYSGFGGEAGSTNNPATGGTIYFVNPLSGTANTVPFENESFGVAYSSLDFHDSQIPIGVDQNGKWYFTPFKAVPNGRKDFFVTGVGDQNELSGGFSNKWGGLFFSGDHTSKQGVIPDDTYQRNGGRINGNATWGKLTVQIGGSFYNVSTNIAGNSYYQYRPVYYLVVDQLASTDLKSIKDISKFQNNQGFVNAYAPNPWWNIFNSRSKSSQDQLLSHVSLSYKINDWLTITGRTGYSRTMENAPSFIDSITFPSWLLGPNGGGLWNNGGLANFPGNNPGIQRETVKAHYDDWNTDAWFTASKTFGKFKFNLIAGGNYRARTSWGDWYSNQVYYENVVGANFIPSYPSKVLHQDGSADAVFSYKRYDQSAYGDLSIGYDNWLFLHGSFRNDWTSILSPQNRSFSYPSVDLSAVLSDKLAFLQNSSTISFLKVRLGYAGTGNVSLDNYQRMGTMGNIGAGTQNPGAYNGGYSYLLPTFGAYAIYPIAGTIPGFPFGSNNGYSQSGTLVQNGLKPEKTGSAEVGFQLGLLKNRINLEVNYYDQQSTNQTIPLQASTSTGISSYLTNAGKINNYGVEIDLSLNPVFQSRNFRFDLSGNFAYQNSKVISIEGGSVELDQINFGQIQLGGIYAEAGKSYPQIKVTDFERDPQGHIIVGASSGLPILNPNPVDAGSGNFRYFFGLSPSFGYKGLTLKTVFDYRGGARILNEEGNVMDFTGIYTGDAANRQAFIVPGSVIQTSPGKYVPNTNVPISSVSGLPTSLFWWANYYNQAGMPYVTTAAFWKLREVALSYTVPMRIFGKQNVLKRLDVSLIGRNLFMWRPKTNNLTDPEFSTNGLGNAVGYTTEFQTPPTRVFSASIRANIF